MMVAGGAGGGAGGGDVRVRARTLGPRVRHILEVDALPERTGLGAVARRQPRPLSGLARSLQRAAAGRTYSTLGQGNGVVGGILAIAIDAGAHPRETRVPPGVRLL
jgi:hypothetical protein